MKIDKKVYINNFHSISCAGNTSEELFESICEKRDCISIDSTYVKDRDVAIGKIKNNKSFKTLLYDGCKKVLEESNLDDYSNTLLIVGSSVGGMISTEKSFFKDKNYKNIDYKQHSIDSIAYNLKKEFTFYDDISFSTACTSSANALGYAKEVLAKGIYKNVLVVGVDSLCSTTVCGFAALSVLSSKPCTPFEKNREGMNVSEALAVILLQNDKNKNSVELCGVGYSSDSHHMTQPHPDGLGAKNAIENALDDANISFKEVSYINAHGTGTMANDNSEAKAIASLFPNKPYVSSTKSITGHTLGAAGAVEAIICTMCIQKQIIPPSKNIENPFLEDILFTNEMTFQEVNYIVSNSFAFGGNNTSLVFGKCNEN